MGFDDFFKEWKDTNDYLTAVAISEVIVMFLILAWIFVNIPTEGNRAAIFLWLIFASALVAGLDTIKENNKFFSYVDYGVSVNNFVLSIVVGGVIALLVSFNSFSLLAPFSIVSGNNFMNFLYIVIAAPFVEEKFFRGFLNSSSGVLFKVLKFVPFPYTSGVLFSCMIFGVFHFIAYGGLIESMLVAMLFGLIASIGNYFFKSRGFGLGLHIVTNFIVIGGFGYLLGLI